jgi:hypothetical protein
LNGFSPFTSSKVAISSRSAATSSLVMVNARWLEWGVEIFYESAVALRFSSAATASMNYLVFWSENEVAAEKSFRGDHA